VAVAISSTKKVDVDLLGQHQQRKRINAIRSGRSMRFKTRKTKIGEK
jgi:hypothetical protein